MSMDQVYAVAAVAVRSRDGRHAPTGPRHGSGRPSSSGSGRGAARGRCASPRAWAAGGPRPAVPGQPAASTALPPLRGPDGSARRRARARLRQRERGGRPPPREAARGGRRPPHLHGRLDALAGGHPQGPARLPGRRVPLRRRARDGPAGGELRRRARPLDAARRPAVGPAFDRGGARAAAAPGGRLFSREPTGAKHGMPAARGARGSSPPPASPRRTARRAGCRFIGAYYRAVWTKPA